MSSKVIKGKRNHYNKCNNNRCVCICPSTVCPTSIPCIPPSFALAAADDTNELSVSAGDVFTMIAIGGGGAGATSQISQMEDVQVSAAGGGGGRGRFEILENYTIGTTGTLRYVIGLGGITGGNGGDSIILFKPADGSQEIELLRASGGRASFSINGGDGGGGGGAGAIGSSPLIGAGGSAFVGEPTPQNIGGAGANSFLTDEGGAGGVGVSGPSGLPDFGLLSGQRGIGGRGGITTSQWPPPGGGGAGGVGAINSQIKGGDGSNGDPAGGKGGTGYGAGGGGGTFPQSGPSVRTGGDGAPGAIGIYRINR